MVNIKNSIQYDSIKWNERTLRHCIYAAIIYVNVSALYVNSLCLHF
jgi:hypothetical protein